MRIQDGTNMSIVMVLNSQDFVTRSLHEFRDTEPFMVGALAIDYASRGRLKLSGLVTKCDMLPVSRLRVQI